MMRFLLALLVSLPLVAGPGQMVLLGVKPASAGTCTTLVSLLASAGNDTATPTSISQKIRNDSGMTVCGATFGLAGTGNAIASLWSNPDGTGTQYGTDSNAAALGALALVSFTWASNPTVSASTHFYLVVKPQTAGDITTFQHANDDYETGNSYSGYVDGSLYGGSVDIRFALSTIQ